MQERTEPLRVAYLVNQYPAVSHTFIRREIEALERQQVVVQRIALRGWDATLVDRTDCDEQTRTKYVLARGAAGLFAALSQAAIRSPRRLWHATQLAWQMARQSDQPLVKHLAYLGEACVVRDWANAAGARHLHAHFATNSAEVAMLAHALGGPPYSFTAHGSDIMDKPSQIGLPVTVGHAAFVVAVCSFGRSQIFKWVPHALWDRVQVVRCGIEPGYALGAEPAAPASKRLVCVGRLSKEKGQILLVHAARQLARAGIEFELVLAGDGPMRGEVQRLVEQFGLTGRITITGWLDAAEIERELLRARALVVPSLSEGLPVVIMEAMAARRPVVAPYLAGIPELVTDGRNGWLYPAGDVNSLASAMLACLNADDLDMLAKGESARADVRRLHDVNVEAKKLSQLFDNSARSTLERVDA